MFQNDFPYMLLILVHIVTVRICWRFVMTEFVHTRPEKTSTNPEWHRTEFQFVSTTQK